MGKKSKLIASSVAALAVVGGVFSAAPAYAAWNYCSAGFVCAYIDADGTGSNFYGQYDNTTWNSFNNTASSLWNNGNTSNVNVYTGTSYTGSGFTVYRGTGNRHTNLFYDNTGGVGVGYWNDNLASNLWI